MLRQHSDYLSIPSPDEIYVQEILNYHLHKIPFPTHEKAFVSNAFLHPKMDADGRNWLQVGIATERFEDISQAPAANITLVIDRSGSMAGDRIEKARSAAVALVEMMRPKDRVAVVAFDDQVEIIWKSSLVGSEKGKIVKAIRDLQERGSTDLNAGMVAGYEETIRHYDHETPAKIIMLTDAIANTGIIDPVAMAKNSRHYDAKYKVEMAMVGIGVDFNQNLSRKLVGSQGASLHFLHDGQDIQKVFVEEFQTLISPIGSNPVLSITVPGGYKVEQIPGYTFTQMGNQVMIELERLNAGLTEVLMVEVSSESKKSNPEVASSLRYLSYGTEKVVEIAGKEGSTAQEVKRNLTILNMALAYQKMAEDVKKQNYQQGQSVLHQALLQARVDYPEKADDAVDSLYKLLEGYDNSLTQHLASIQPTTQPIGQPLKN